MLKISVSARGLHGNLERKLNQYVSRISVDMIDEIAVKAGDYAWDLYSEAEYAGEEPLNVITVDVEDSGPLSRAIVVDDDGTGIATYIEYGTGIYAQKRSANGLRLTPRKHTKSGRWFFYDDERREQGPIEVNQNDYVERAEPRKRKKYEDVYEVTGIHEGEDIKTGEKEWWGDYEEDSREGVWTTHGNPPNDIMVKTKEYILSKALPEVAKKTKGVRYTQW